MRTVVGAGSKSAEACQRRSNFRSWRNAVKRTTVHPCGWKISPSGGLFMHYLDWVPHFGPSGLAEWLILAISIHEAYYTRQERQRQKGRSVSAPLTSQPRYWPWIVLAVAATVLA